MENIKQAWNALRATLHKKFSFYEIKDIVGLAGFDLLSISHLEQKAEGNVSKGQLMTGIDDGLRNLNLESFKHFIAIVTEEVLKRKPDSRENLEENLARLGWSLSSNSVIPIEIFDNSILPDLPTESHQDITKAAERLRDGDLSGAISAMCGALDTATSVVYKSVRLGDATNVSFQERCKRSLEAKGIIPQMKQQLRELGWNEHEITQFRKNFEGAMNQGAYVIQTLRSNMGDVHGTKPILKPLVFDCLKWTEIMLRALKEVS